MTFRAFIDGRPVSSKLTRAQLAKLQRDDNHAQILNQFLADDAKVNDGTYGFMGSISDPSRGITAPKGMTADISRAERIQRVRDRMSRREPCKPLAYVEGYEVDLLSTEDQEAYEEGWICPNCIQYQTLPGPECNWQFRGPRPSNPKLWGCGYRRL